MEIEQATSVHANTSSSPRRRTVQAVVLLIIGTWGLYASCGTLAVYLYGRLPLSDFLHSYLPIPAFIIGCALVYVSARLWRRWRMGLGVAAVIEGLMLALASAGTVFTTESRNAPPHGIFTISIIGCVTGVGLVVWQIMLDRRPVVETRYEDRSAKSE